MSQQEFEDIDIIIQANHECDQYDLDTFNNIIFYDKQLKMLHLNIRSFNRNSGEFLVFLEKLDVKLCRS